MWEVVLESEASIVTVVSDVTQARLSHNDARTKRKKAASLPRRAMQEVMLTALDDFRSMKAGEGT